MVLFIKFSTLTSFSTLTGYSAFASLIKMILLLVLFVLILIASYYVTRWYAKSDFINKRTKNISVVESFQVSPGKLIYIVKIGNKYIAMAGTKEQMCFLTELNPDELDFEMRQPSEAAPFSDIFSQIIKKKHTK